METGAQRGWDAGIDWDRLAGKGSGLDPSTRLGVAMLLDTVRRYAAPRRFLACELPLLTLSQLLWEAGGSSAWDAGEPAGADGGIDVYVALASGSYRFDPAWRALEACACHDIRPLLAHADGQADAPINLVYVQRPARHARLGAREAAALAALRTATLVENVARFCAAHELATVARGQPDRAALAAALGLAPGQVPLLAQSVGYAAPTRSGRAWDVLELERMLRRTQ